MPIDQLIFVGMNGYVLALHRATGAVIWSTERLRGYQITLLLDGELLIASTSGDTYCLEPTTGKIRWHAPLKGYGLAAAPALVSVRGRCSPDTSLGIMG